LTAIEEKYGKDDQYQQIFPFMSKDAIDNHLPLMFTYVVMEELN